MKEFRLDVLRLFRRPGRSSFDASVADPRSEAGEQVLAALPSALRTSLLETDLTYEMSDDPECVSAGRRSAAELRRDLAAALANEDLETLAAAMFARVHHEPVRVAALMTILPTLKP